MHYKPEDDNVTLFKTNPLLRFSLRTLFLHRVYDRKFLVQTSKRETRTFQKLPENFEEEEKEGMKEGIP